MSEVVVGAGEELPTKHELIRRIERLHISADAKALLLDIAAVTVEVGGKLVAAGRRIIAFILDCARQYPNTAFGLLAAGVVAALVASVPFLGVILAPLLTPLLLAFGLVKGAMADLKESGLKARISRLEETFNAMAPGTL